MVNLILAVLAIGTCLSGPIQKRAPQELSTEVLIPHGMPMKAMVQGEPDQKDPLITIYTVKRTVPKWVQGAVFLVFMTDGDGQILPDTELRVPSYSLSDPMTLATCDKRVAKIMVVVESVQTTTGTWVLDSPNGTVLAEDIAKQGARALPKAVFVASKTMRR